MIVKTEMINGGQLEVHENRSGHRRYWATVNHRALFQRGSLRVRTFTTPDAAWTAALREARISPKITRTHTPGYSIFGGGGPFAPMSSPRRPPK
mgnify:CR=1 FL=1